MRTWMVLLGSVSAFLGGVVATGVAQQPQPRPAAPPVAAPTPAPTSPPTPAPTGAEPAPIPTPPPPPATPPSSDFPAPTAADQATAPPPPPARAPANCLPGCRTGFTCVDGRCISSCNPPCSIGDYCSADGECISRPIEPLPGSEGAARAKPGFETHDGFFFRVTSGFGGGAVTLDIPDRSEQTYAGVGWSTSVDVGGSPVNDLVIFGRLRGAWLIEPELRIDDEEIADTDGLAVNQGLLGAGINYYLMPLNLYFGGVVGFAVVETVQSRRNRDDRTDTSDIGFGVDLDVGKEWWIDDNWGVGVALRLSLSAVPAEDLGRDAMFGSGFFAVLFSATYQ